ncbi:MAG TPA: hypothetical protein VHE54_20070, partial [Puia sp.]|nr:hypothetical protein [Puia sp.]
MSFVSKLLLPMAVLFSHPVLSQWKASWISVPGINPHGYGVYWFRQCQSLSAVPDSLPVFVSADNRYKLFVNGQLVSLGPARGDIPHWRFATVNLAPYLRVGSNCIAAQVWNEGNDKPEAQPSLRTAFILEAATDEGGVWDTDTAWECRADSGYSPIRVHLPFYYVAGPGEYQDMRRHIGAADVPQSGGPEWRH